MMVKMSAPEDQMKFEIVCDSATDLAADYAQQAHLTVVPFYVSMDGEHYMKEGVDISIAQFYQAMVDHADCFPKTSMPSIQDYMDAFIPLVEQKIPVLCICLTRKFSGSLQSAQNAKIAVEEEYPDAQICVMDSQLVTDLQGLFVKEAIRLRDMDLSLEQAVPLLEEIRETGHIFFTTKDLKYLRHGGRLGKVASIAGSMLDLKPVLHFCNGELAPTEVCRGRKRSLQKVADKFMTFLEQEQLDLKGYRMATGIGLDVPEYPEFQQMLLDRMKEKGICPDELTQMHIGATIGVHTGPYPIGLGILKKCNI